uniref:Glyco_transf_7N domain-containing protein n=1 Tax=Steinernema glaseri TaxID=37863 RepID=A0A1I7YK87_9BILA
MSNKRLLVVFLLILLVIYSLCTQFHHDGIAVSQSDNTTLQSDRKCGVKIVAAIVWKDIPNVVELCRALRSSPDYKNKSLQYVFFLIQHIPGFYRDMVENECQNVFFRTNALDIDTDEAIRDHAKSQSLKNLIYNADKVIRMNRMGSIEVIDRSLYEKDLFTSRLRKQRYFYAVMEDM